MSDANKSETRTMGQSIGYWTVIYLIAIPILFIATGLLVRMALSLAA